MAEGRGGWRWLIMGFWMFSVSFTFLGLVRIQFANLSIGLHQRANHPREQLKLLHGSLFDIKCFDCRTYQNYPTSPLIPSPIPSSHQSKPKHKPQTNTQKPTSNTTTSPTRSTPASPPPHPRRTPATSRTAPPAAPASSARA